MRLLLILCGVLVFATFALLFFQDSGTKKKPFLAEQVDEMPIGFEAAKNSIRIVDENEQPVSPVPDNDSLIARLPSIAPKPIAKNNKVSSQKSVSIELVRPLVKRAGWMTTDEYTVSLSNIEAPSPQDWCQGVSKPWPCGPLARTAMRKFIRGRTAVCITQATERKNGKKAPRSAQCLVGGIDVAKWLVEQGWAFADAGSELENTMTIARDKQKGLWRYGAKVNLVARPEG